MPKMNTHITAAAVAISCALSGAALAQEASAPAATTTTEAAAPAAPTCELHVFPTIEGQAQTTGWLSGFGAIGAIADASANKNRNVGDAAYLKEALGPAMQVEALKALDLATALKLPASQVVFETPIADRNVTTKAGNRLSTSTAPCYVELIVTQNLYTKRPIYGRALNNRFIVKDFRTGKTKTELKKGRGGNGLTLFPPKTTEEAAAAEKELQEVFTKNFLEFAGTTTTAAK
ncbi:hypothetical protein [Novosphingobium taihuense]|uniref:Uncharacterized protein n=1 Tax=Novosphingobium taihuense TaxID=260085 RepID=A0A7W7A7X5_9SPHN|nr:hypothetical protein [Novosphingobium taihuense]MBB4612085.1 hypothetical protein [Novosphingobium taihuense]TWH88562.1 hypothetical protein IQ25_00685 [Novosphingobium taihuense]